MAFNFNWSPLTADASFYQRARDLLTTALNKSPKPPIIVDDILVTEFNLGSVPPELEILEIGDLAEDRFRGIFKMTYSGDAFLTLKTRVQANPLNTYLYSKPSFTSPEPLAAASGLTIPLQITLSEIKLSAFIILVFSKQKGLTLVFRNDPLESLKVSSTFDSIQFVRDYLQRTIEGKLRNLMMDELPAIIHKLSLQLWCPEQMSKEDHERTHEMDEQAVNPFASPPLDAVDAHGNLLDPIEISSIAVNGGSELQSLFSQKNLYRLGNLVNTQLTSSLFTPSVPEVIFRARAGPVDRPDASNPPPTAMPPSLVKSHSFHGSSTVYTFSDTSSQNNGQLPSRPSLVSLGSATTGLGLGASRNAKPYANRKKKTRVVNLRRKTDTAVSSEMGDTMSDSASVQASESIAMSDSIPEEPEEQSEQVISGSSRVRFGLGAEMAPLPQRPALQRDLFNPEVETPSAEVSQPRVAQPNQEKETTGPVKPLEKARSSSSTRRGAHSETPSVILEQAWIMKMAGEIAKRVYDEKQRNPSFWDEREDSPPPAYEAQPGTAAS